MSDKGKTATEELPAVGGSAPSESMQLAAQLKWSEPSLTWLELAKRAGISERTIHRMRKTEAWEIAFREAGADYIEKLAPAAVQALIDQWAKGNASGAVEVLRSFGFLKVEEKKIDHTITTFTVDITGGRSSG